MFEKEYIIIPSKIVNCKTESSQDISANDYCKDYRYLWEKKFNNENFGHLSVYGLFKNKKLT